MFRRGFLIAAAAAVASPARAEDTPGVTATEIKIGNTAAYSGPASAYGVIARTEAAFFKMVNDQGGVGGRQIDYTSGPRF
jgi:branched-chain amino acid transport system substrate-binding protein